ncbi:MAG: hypothetical protein JWQ02_1251 [Capsulimonas sp.]|nr:hypothetical protein [Capsulimonas sp.]
MKKNNVVQLLSGLSCLSAVGALLLGGMGTAQAFTASDRSTALSCYNNTFYYTLNSGTQGFYRASDGTGNITSFWQFAEQIELVCDTGNVAAVNQVCAGFTARMGTDWTWNTYNDDLMWASIAFSRAYQLTGNTTYRTLAANGFNVAWNRGWDTVNTGMWWNTNKDVKTGCVNGPGGIAAYLLSVTLGDASYKTKAQQFHTWEINYLYDNATGSVKGSPAGTDFNTYDSGTFAATAYYLGDTSRYPAAGRWVQNHWGVTMQTSGYGSDAGGFNGICLRWLAKTGYNIPYLQACVNNGWAYRNSRGLSDCCWYRRTPDSPTVLYSWDCSSVVVGMLCVPPG